MTRDTAALPLHAQDSAVISVDPASVTREQVIAFLEETKAHVLAVPITPVR
ncbi:MAG TPA: hypothetical protein VGQ76_21550 [Thermoanaerobaculia bacterium]|jgi:hypothetical protein|nr:hypothetical protein [Thermoanaerobaculia bacterium]